VQKVFNPRYSPAWNASQTRRKAAGESLGFDTESLLHVVVLDKDHEGDLGGDERLGQVLRLHGCEGIKVLRPLLPRLLRLVGGATGHASSTKMRMEPQSAP
jgi:hypothetical protein